MRNVVFNLYLNLIIICTANKQKWVPLEIDLAQNRGTMRSPRFQNHRERNGEGNFICMYNGCAYVRAYVTCVCNLTVGT